MVPEARENATRRSIRLRQRVEQQFDYLGSNVPDLQSAERLFGRTTRRAAGSRPAVDLFVAQGTERSLRPDRLLFLGCLEFLQEYLGGESPSSAYFNPRNTRKACCRQRWVRYPTVQELARLPDLGGGRPAQGHQLLVSAARRRDLEHHRLSGAAQDRDSNLRAGDHDQDDRKVHTAKGVDRRFHELGPVRNREFYALVRYYRGRSLAHPLQVERLNGRWSAQGVAALHKGRSRCEGRPHRANDIRCAHQEIVR